MSCCPTPTDSRWSADYATTAWLPAADASDRACSCADRACWSAVTACWAWATSWALAPHGTVTVGVLLLLLLGLLEEPLATAEIARRLRATPSAVSQHLQVLHANGLVARARSGRHVLYRRSSLGDQLISQPSLA